MRAEEVYALLSSKIKGVTSGFDHAEKTSDNSFRLYFADGSYVDLSLPEISESELLDAINTVFTEHADVLSGVVVSETAPTITPYTKAWINPKGGASVKNYINDTVDAKTAEIKSQLDGVESDVETKVGKYNTFSEVIADTTLAIGDVVITKGYYVENDGGNGTYSIKNSDDGIGIKLDNNLYANLMYDSYISPSALGFLPDHADKNILNKALVVNSCVLRNGTYALDGDITVPSNRTLDLNGAKIMGRVTFRNSYHATIKNGFIQNDAQNGIGLYFDGSRNGNTLVDNLEITATIGIHMQTDTGYNLFKHVKVMATSACVFINKSSSMQYVSNYIYFDKCAFSGTGIGISLGEVAYFWVTNCDILSSKGIMFNKKAENVNILNNVFFGNNISIQSLQSANIYNMHCVGNVFSDQESIGTTPAFMQGEVYYSDFDNKFFNVANGYSLNSVHFTSLGSTLDELNGHLRNTIGSSDTIIRNKTISKKESFGTEDVGTQKSIVLNSYGAIVDPVPSVCGYGYNIVNIVSQEYETTITYEPTSSGKIYASISY